MSELTPARELALCRLQMEEIYAEQHALRRQLSDGRSGVFVRESATARIKALDEERVRCQLRINQLRARFALNAFGDAQVGVPRPPDVEPLIDSTEADEVAAVVEEAFVVMLPTAATTPGQHGRPDYLALLGQRDPQRRRYALTTPIGRVA